MRKGTKRKAARKEEDKPAEPKPDKAPSRAKRTKLPKPESEPEYFEDKRNMVFYILLFLLQDFVLQSLLSL